VGAPTPLAAPGTPSPPAHTSPTVIALAASALGAPGGIIPAGCTVAVRINNVKNPPFVQAAANVAFTTFLNDGITEIDTITGTAMIMGITIMGTIMGTGTGMRNTATILNRCIPF
jgi:hypothetical protein